MADEQVQETPAAEPEESLAEFVARENALERGDPEPEPTPEPEPEPEPAATTATTDAPRIDKRTKDGRKLSIQQEIDALTAAKHEAKRELEAHQAELARLRTQRPQPQQPTQRTDSQPPAAPSADAEPTLNDFMKLADGTANPDPYTSYMRALSKWDAHQIVQQVAQQSAAERHQAAIGQTWAGKLAEIRQTVPDIDQRLNQTPIDQRVWPFVQNHPQGPDIAVYLSQNPQEAQALLRLHPIEQVGRIGEIAGSIKSRSAAAPVAQRRPPVVSAAKPPIQPLGTSPVAASPDPGDDEPLSAFIERENKAERKQRMR